MSTISKKHKKNFQVFTYSDDFENVVHGLVLLDTLTEEEKMKIQENFGEKVHF